MSKSSQKPAPFPSREQILEYIRDNPSHIGKREIARAFKLNADQKVMLKHLLKELERDGAILRGRGRRFAEPGTLPSVAMVEVTGADLDGEVLARPLKWDDEQGPAPVIYMAPERRGHPALGAGDRVLARLSKTKEGSYDGFTIRRITGAPEHVLGVYRIEEDGVGRIKPTQRRARDEFAVARGQSLNAVAGDLVWAEILPGRKLGLREAKVVDVLGKTGGTKAISLIAIHERDIPVEFPDEALKLADDAGAPPLQDREDLRDIPLVTIDGADARDFDDAVWAEEDEKNPGGWHLLVAIADVAHYVRPGDALDRCAYERGNSVYLPDRVVPMLPEALSNGWCSLRPDEVRSCLAVHLWIDGEGKLLRHRFVRGLMRSVARLTYEEVQAAHDGEGGPAVALADTVIAPLYGAYRALMKGRVKRGVLDLDLPERRIVLDDEGTVTGVVLRPRFDSHRLIEEFMITANVAAAVELEKRKQPCMYRIHDEPSQDKVESLRQFLDSIGISFAKGQVLKPALFNRILEKARGTPNVHMVNEVVLRSQSQAEYSPNNIGHFGLALSRYCHFTSPIRRYSDLLVHRALIRGLKMGEGGLEDDPKDFTQMGEHISATERQAAAAERDAVDRFKAAFLAERVGAVFPGRVNGVTRFGLFVTLEESGADGLVPIRTLPDDYYIHDESRHSLTGRTNGLEYRLGDQVETMLMEADPVTGGMILQILDDGVAKPRKSRRPQSAGKGRKPQGRNIKSAGVKAGRPKKTKRGRRR